MKKIILILLFFSTFKLLAQDPQLYANPWHLHTVTVGGVFYPATFPVQIFFFENELSFGNVDCDTVLFNSPTYFGNQEFTVVNGGGVGDGCPTNMTAQTAFYALHYAVYYDETENAIAPLSYNLTSAGGHFTLTITNAQGDFAVYGDTELSTPAYSSAKLTVLPNPTTDVIEITGTKAVDFSTATIYDLNGRKLRFSRTTTVSVNNLESGVYLLEIQMKNGSATTLKFIKH